MTPRFYPKGYIGSEQGILRVARLRDPKHWLPELISPEELLIWQGLGKSYNALFLSNHLSVSVPVERREDTSMIDRLCDYGDAMIEIQRALHAGDIVAEFLDDAGKFGFVLKEGWGGAAADELLLCGLVPLGDVRDRVILFNTAELDKFATSLPPAVPPSQDGGDEDCSIARPASAKLSASEKRRFFEEWRSSVTDHIPTIEEDTAKMKTHGISREDTRGLRREFPAGKAGRPKLNRGIEN